MTDATCSDQPSAEGRRGALFCFGYGYSAEALGRDLIEQGRRVFGTTRSEEKRQRLAQAGVEAILDDDLAAVAQGLAQCDQVLVSAGPSAAGDPTLARHGDALRREAGRLRWIGYLSTTAVYGDRGGDWVDEDSERLPATERGRWRVAAEDEWLAFGAQSGAPAHLFRLAGIYGPGRGPFAKLRAGAARRIVKPGQVFSRIHVDDIASTLEASMAQPRAGAAYNVCDDEPAPPSEVIAFAANLLGVTPPPEETFEEARAKMSPMAASFYAESKRVSNKRIKDELGVELAYPGYREGLVAVLAEEDAGERLGL
ncbi:MAG: SDR family oxidoreductase [Neomegalonema sp.]|nr:SDR family oxidoreductase [Neomegalonema sp.]